jgi:hypothetical protein
MHRGVLAEYLNTNFAEKIHLCHACHNSKCSNQGKDYSMDVLQAIKNFGNNEENFVVLTEMQWYILCNTLRNHHDAYKAMQKLNLEILPINID